MNSGFQVNDVIQKLQKKVEKAQQKINILEAMMESRTKELYMTNVQLESQNHDLEQIVYITSHDLQEPLRTISNFTGLLKELHLKEENEESERYINYIQGATVKMQNLIKDLLDISRVGKNHMFETVDCNKILFTVTGLLNASLEESNTKLIINKLPVLKGNETELQQLFQNLISNAIKFRRKEVQPIVEVSAEEKENEYLFSIKDNGIGIAEKYFDKLFMIFQRLHTENEYPGTGIGLATCKKIVNYHKGKIWLESKIDEGSTFYFTISKFI